MYFILYKNIRADGLNIAKIMSIDLKDIILSKTSLRFEIQI